MYKDGRSGRETARLTTEITEVKGNTAHAKAWRGGLTDRPASLDEVRGIRTFVMDPKTKMIGASILQVDRLEYKPFEPWGCLPMELGKNCLSEPFQFEVKSTQFPDWYSGTVWGAQYAKDKETFVVERTGKKLEVLRFVLKVRRNNGTYERHFLHAAHLPYPIHIENRYVSGVVDWTESIVEYKLR